MQESTDPKRNLPSDKGERNDPHKRDEDARQPGVSTMSSSKNDDDNQHLSKTASDNFEETKPGDEKADKAFDD